MEFPKEHNPEECPAAYVYFRKIKAVQGRASQARILRQLLSTEGYFAALDAAKTAKDAFAVCAVRDCASALIAGGLEELEREHAIDKRKFA